MSIDLAQFHQVYFDESFEGLETMESALLNLDLGAADPEVVNQIFRAAHSIKGGSGTFGFSEIADFTHVLETLLDEVREGKRQVVQTLVDLMLESVDVLREMMAATQSGEALDTHRIGDVHGRLKALQGAVDLDSPETVLSQGGSDPKPIGWIIGFKPEINVLATGNDPVRMFRELGELGTLEVTVDDTRLPSLSELDPAECHLSWTLELRGESIEETAVREVFEWVEDECELVIEPIVRDAADTPPTSTEPPSPLGSDSSSERDGTAPRDKGAKPAKPKERELVGAGEQGSIRVSIRKVDELINMVGELVITQSMLSEVGRDFQPESIERLLDGLTQLERNTRELQENVMQIRMLPISSSFNRFPRLVRDMSNKLGKKVELKLLGESTELDKTVLEKIGDPLVHLVRNSLDHGLETPEERCACGKPETGTLTLNAFHAGGDIVIEVSDDGRGINSEKVLAKARERGLVGEQEELSVERINNLIFHPGFSTADTVSDISGRGVGMDVVRRNIKDLGGSVDVQSQIGTGSTMTIRLPLTLAILDGQLVSVGDQTYIISLLSIVESRQVQPELVSTVGRDTELYKVRDDFVPIVRLHEMFGIADARETLEDGLLVLVEADGERIGLFVDDLQGQQQVVIKSLEANYKQVPGLTGATILGDGTVALILDVPGFIQRYGGDANTESSPSHLNRDAAPKAA